MTAFASGGQQKQFGSRPSISRAPGRPTAPPTEAAALFRASWAGFDRGTITAYRSLRHIAARVSSEEFVAVMDGLIADEEQRQAAIR